MSAPRIASAAWRPLRKQAPPARARPHLWSAHPRAPVALYLEEGAALEVERQVEAAAGRSRETMGLLLGDRFESPSGALYSVAWATATGGLRATSDHVRFDPERIGEVAAALDREGSESVLVGWFHSHLGAGVALSPTDERTARRYLFSSHQVDWVIDPVLRKSACYRLEADAFEPRALALFSFEAGKPDPYRTPRRPLG